MEPADGTPSPTGAAPCRPDWGGALPSHVLRFVSAASGKTPDSPGGAAAVCRHWQAQLGVRKIAPPEFNRFAPDGDAIHRERWVTLLTILRNRRMDGRLRGLRALDLSILNCDGPEHAEMFVELLGILDESGCELEELGVPPAGGFPVKLLAASADDTRDATLCELGLASFRCCTAGLAFLRTCRSTLAAVIEFLRHGRARRPGVADQGPLTAGHPLRELECWCAWVGADDLLALAAAAPTLRKLSLFCCRGAVSQAFQRLGAPRPAVALLPALEHLDLACISISLAEFEPLFRTLAEHAPNLGTLEVTYRTQELRWERATHAWPPALRIVAFDTWVTFLGADEPH